MYKSVILPVAKEDIKEAAAWYNNKQKGLGRKFTFEVKKKTHFIRQFPKSFAKRYEDARTALTDVFPFLIHYIIDDSEKTVIIIAVLHTSRNPDILRKRHSEKPGD